ncbi:MAG: TldD/PmbA family protein [Armatimonadetes bacterium]|nr:TldD/PmbA family protein [Armatimonadota bacterium]
MASTDIVGLAQAAVEACPADQAEAFVYEARSAVTRFAENTIHQNTSEYHRSLTVRAVVGRRIATARAEVASIDDARRLAVEAAELARVAQELPDFVSLPAPKPIPPNPRRPAPDVVEATAGTRADLVSAATDQAQKRGYRAAGALTVEISSICVANSLGILAARESSGCHFHVVTRGEDTAGYAASEGPALADAKVAETAELAADIADQAKQRQSVEPKPMDVVLRPVAAAELLGAFAATGFSALAYQEQQSFVCDWLGQRACAPELTVIDDGMDTRTYAASFDYEGVPKQRVDLIRDGVVCGLVYDSYTAGREVPPRESTGHAAPPGYGAGPTPMNLVVHQGDAALDDLISRIDRGLLVSRIHYLNIAHRRQALFTGMTREGTLLIRNGRIVGGVLDLRFTERMVEAFRRLVAIGMHGELHGHVWTPPLVIEAFSFTSATTL